MHKSAAIAALVIGLGAVGTVAYATTPAPTVVSCVKNGDPGHTVHNFTAPCPKGFYIYNATVTGVSGTGLPGPMGPQGVPGPTGPAGLSGAPGAPGAACPLTMHAYLATPKPVYNVDGTPTATVTASPVDVNICVKG